MEEPLMEREFDLRLQLPNHALFVGASMSGKTQLVLRLLRAAPTTLHPVPRTVLLFYDQWQDEYQALRQQLHRHGILLKTFQGGGSLTLTDLDKHDHQTLVVIDDASEETSASMDIAKITTNGRHKNVSLWLIWHSLFSKHPASRIISQNVGYMFFLPSPRLASQMQCLDRQLGLKGALLSAYSTSADEEEWDQRYLCLDLATKTPGQFRLRSQVDCPTAQTLYFQSTTSFPTARL